MWPINMQKRFLWGGAGLLVAILALTGYVSWLKSGGENSLLVSSSTLSGARPASSTILKKDTGGSHPGLTYGEALRYYADRRMQFDPNCIASPNNMSLRNGVSVMFDNRAPSSTTIALDGIAYLVRGYDFRILTLRSGKLPHKIAVDCGSGKNNAQIILQ
jgi:hypothetical protein